MSSKDDRDNRANQLNPNNDAYYNSRGIDRESDDDDYDYDCCAGIGIGKALHEMFAREDRERRQWEDNQPVYERFKLDFLSLDGQKSHLEIMAKLPRKGFSSGRVSDCTDLIRIVFFDLLSAFSRATEAPVAYYQVRDGQGKTLDWLSGTYRPKPPDYHHTAEQQAKIERENLLWETSGEADVSRFKELLNSEIEAEIPRTSSGMVTVDCQNRIGLVPENQVANLHIRFKFSMLHHTTHSA